jgi:hypothetical protein
MLKRLLPQIGSLTLIGVAWRHRASIIRVADLARHAPQHLLDGHPQELATEARAVLALDAALPESSNVRIRGVENGTVSLRGQGPVGHDLETARDTLLSVMMLVDVDSDDLGQQNFNDLLAAQA